MMSSKISGGIRKAPSALRLAVLSGTALAAMACAGNANAQDSGPDGAVGLGKAGIEDIVVTARRREESLQDTPISIAAVSGKALEARGIITVTDIGDFTANVKFNASAPVSASNSTAAIFIRGIGQNNWEISADPGVGLYLDGVYISRGVGNVLDALNIERIEVLRGPQGTLFGRNTIGGAVSVVTRKPGNTFKVDAEVTTGSFNRLQIKGSVDIPVAEGVYTNLSGFYHRRDGYVKGVLPDAPDLGDTDALAGRLAVRLEPSDTVKIDLALDGTRNREESAPNVLIATDESAPAAQVYNALYSGAPGVCANPTNAARLSDPRCFNNQWVLGPYRHAGTFKTNLPLFDNLGPNRYQSASHMDIWGASGTIEWEISPALTAKSITAYRKVKGFWFRDSDHSPVSITQTKSRWDQEQFSQELQLSGTSLDGDLKWLLGAYYSRETGKANDLVQLVDVVFLSGGIIKGRSLAGFGQATYEITQGLNLTAGVRWTEDRKTFGNADQYLIEAGFLTGAPLNPDGSGLQDGDPLMGPRGMEREIKDRAWTPMVNLSYRWSDEWLTYASYSKGFKGGGFSQRIFPPLDFIPAFKPEKSTTYEVGFKSDLFDRRLRVNGAAFKNDYSNLQVAVNDPTLGFAPIAQNAAKALIKGFELELQARPVTGLNIDASLGYLDAKYTDVQLRAVNAGVNKDSKLQNAPEWTLSAGIAYDFDLGSAGRLTPRVDWSYRSLVYNDAVNTPILAQAGYHMVNAAINYQSADARWGLSLGVKNLTKELYINSGYIDTFSGLTEALYGRPREWYLSARMKM